MNLPTLPPDKLGHIVYGALIADVGRLLGIGFLPSQALYIGAVLCVVFAVGKEIYDKKHGTVDYMDAVATIGGGVLALGPSFL